MIGSSRLWHISPHHVRWLPMRSSTAAGRSLAAARQVASQLCLAALCLAIVGGALAQVADAAAPSPLPPQVQAIDQAIAQGWADYQLRPSAEADDATWCRRVYLDVIGRIPTVDELNAYLDERGKDKRAALVAQLLYDDRYTEEYARHWATIWTNILIGRSGGQDRRSLTNRDGMQKYLRDAFASNKPYNELVHDLVTAEGTTKPGAPGFNGATNFLIDKVNDEDAVLATSSTSRIFLGLQVQCTQCHNHPFNQWKQQKFWEFNSFFRQTRALRRFVAGTGDIDHAELVDQDFAGEAGDPADALIFYELRNGLTKVAYPVFVDGVEIAPSGYVSQVHRRRELGRMMLGSPYLDKMLVNRMWGHFLGYGFTKPIDDLGPHNPSSHPQLLEYLGQQVRENSYDMKRLIQWITLSRPYALSSQTTPQNEADDPSLGEVPQFSHFYLRQMQAEQLYQSLITATEAQSKGSYEEQERERRQWLDQFVVAFGTDEGDEATTFNGSIPQALMLFNGDLIKQATDTGPSSYLGRVADSGAKPRDKVSQLFLAALARQPTRDELTIASKLLYARGNDQKAMLQDMWWAILNSNEFIMQH